MGVAAPPEATARTAHQPAACGVAVGYPLDVEALDDVPMAGASRRSSSLVPVAAGADTSQSHLCRRWHSDVCVFVCIMEIQSSIPRSATGIQRLGQVSVG